MLPPLKLRLPVVVRHQVPSHKHTSEPVGELQQVLLVPLRPGLQLPLNILLHSQNILCRHLVQRLHGTFQPLLGGGLERVVGLADQLVMLRPQLPRWGRPSLVVVAARASFCHGSEVLVQQVLPSFRPVLVLRGRYPHEVPEKTLQALTHVIGTSLLQWYHHNSRRATEKALVHRRERPPGRTPGSSCATECWSCQFTAGADARRQTGALHSAPQGH
mmetsp:Transcript_32463/g.84288  ORF Transcript_32463/g.84288 Transcript_32463/m.84288 type:complete len:217 (+) Transcript_32463:1052-1702(+)